MDCSSHWTMTATKEVNYENVETADLFNPQNPQLALQPGATASRALRVVALDEGVDDRCGDRILGYFTANSIAADYLVLPSGDANKTIDNMLRVASRLNEVGTPRVGGAPIGIGGGVLQDVVGMAASLYRRGIAYVRVPTTLLGQIDGSVSAKTRVTTGCAH